MDRTQFFEIESVDVGDGITRRELDFLNHSLSGLELRRAPLYYRVAQGDLAQPDNIAYKVYGDERLWWVVCLANEISCPCADIAVGDLLTIPDRLDLYDFFRMYRKR